MKIEKMIEPIIFEMNQYRMFCIFVRLMYDQVILSEQGFR